MQCIQLNYHAPALFTHKYFHIHGHTNWTYKGFRNYLITKKSEPASTDEAIQHLWFLHLHTLKEAPFVPQTTILKVEKLLAEDAAPSHAASVVLSVRLERSIAAKGENLKKATDVAVGNMKGWLENPSAGVKTPSAGAKRKRERVTDWISIASKSKRHCRFINAAREDVWNLLPPLARETLRGFKLRRKSSEKVIWATNALRQATHWKMMKVLVLEFAYDMEVWELHNQLQENLFYLREMYMQAANLWQENVFAKGTKNNEGWFLWHLHGPLMRIFKAIPNVRLRATDLKGQNNTRGDKHDVLVTHEVFPLDVVVMEAKHHCQGMPMTEDIEKVARAMAGNLNAALSLLPETARGDFEGIVRSFGMINSGLKVMLLEARFMDSIPVIYKVREFEVPKGALVCSQFVDGLELMLSFKDHVKSFLDDLSEARALITPQSTPPSEYGDTGSEIANDDGSVEDNNNLDDNDE